MRSIKLLLFQLILILSASSVIAQSNNATLYGKITDEAGKPVEMANISIKSTSIGTVSNRNGEFLLRIPAKKPVVIVFSIIGYQWVEKNLTAYEEQRLELNVSQSPASRARSVPAAELRPPARLDLVVSWREVYLT